MSKEKLLLSLVPFWSPLNPPLGISLLKSFLTQHGFHVETHDFNTMDELWETLDRYFNILSKMVPVHKRGNFHMVGFDVLGNLLMAYLHKTSRQEKEYRELINVLLQKNYYIDPRGQGNKSLVEEIDRVLEEFYTNLGKALIKVVERVKPDIFGISVFSPSLAPGLFAFRKVKARFPDVETIMGGGVFADHLALDSPNFEVFLEKTRAYIDTIIVGEGELLLTKYLSNELSPGKRVYSLEDIHRETLDLAQAPVPDFSGLNLAAYSQMAAYASRSCPFQCGFCSETVQWGRFRKKTGKQIVDEMASIKNRYGGKLFMFGDSLVNQVITDMSHHLIPRGLDIYWDGYLRTDPEVCDPQNTNLWRKGGFYRARLGVESGSQKVLQLMNKKMSLQQIKDAVSSLANAGIKTTTYWVIGYPGETEDDFKQTLELLTELKDNIYEADWHPFYFFPRGQVFSSQWVKDHGIELLYPEEFNELLMTRTWELRTNPTKEEINDRMNRFGEECRKVGIPNPYSMMEIYQADKRWKELHPNCGPPLLELHNNHHLR